MIYNFEFSVVVPTFNRLSFLQQAVASVLAQSHEDYQLIVVNDGSTDGTAGYLKSLDRHVTALNQANRGPAAARNEGVKHATGRYIAFLDSDDVWPPWALETAHEVVKTFRPSLICGAIRDFTDTVPALERAPLRLEIFSDYLESARAPSFVGTCNLIVQQEVFRRVGGFDENLIVGEDHDFLFRIGTQPGFVRIRSPITIVYRRHAENTSSLLSQACVAAITILAKESKGDYPGAKRRQKERWQLLSRVIRPIAFSSVRAGLGSEAWRVYWESFWLNVRLGRLRFLVGFLLCGLGGTFRARP